MALASIGPRATLQVNNTLSGDDSKLNIELNFKHIDDFDPVKVVEQITPLRRLFEARQRLRDLLTKLDGNDDLDKLLRDVIANTEGLQEIRGQVALHHAATEVRGLPLRDEGAGEVS